MNVELLPSHSREPLRLQTATTFLINGTVAIDAGSLGHALNLEDQSAVRNVIVTHTHADHIGSLPIFVAEVFPLLDAPITVYGTDHSVRVLREHIFNDDIWPNFENLPLEDGQTPSLRYVTVQDDVPFEVDGLRIRAIATNHIVPTSGLLVEEGDTAVLFTADTYKTDRIWEVGHAAPGLKAVYVDVSYPNEMEELAAAAKHLTPDALVEELTKLDRDDVAVLAVHLKPQFRDQVATEIERLARPNIRVGRIAHVESW